MDYLTKEEARAVACPRCGVKEGERCTGVRDDRNHAERVRAARAVRSSERKAARR